PQGHHRRPPPRRRAARPREGGGRRPAHRAGHGRPHRLPAHRPLGERADPRDRLHQPHREGAARLMAVTTAPGTTAPGTTATTPQYKGAELGRSATQASRSAFAGLLSRDLTVLRKNL